MPRYQPRSRPQGLKCAGLDMQAMVPLAEIIIHLICLPAGMKVSNGLALHPRFNFGLRPVSRFSWKKRNSVVVDGGENAA